MLKSVNRKLEKEVWGKGRKEMRFKRNQSNAVDIDGNIVNEYTEREGVKIVIK